MTGKNGGSGEPMQDALLALQVFLLVPAIVASIYSVLASMAVLVFCRRQMPRPAAGDRLPPASILKPVFGLEKDLGGNLRSACLQDYPAYQVVVSVQRLDDPALPLLRELESEFGPDRVTVVVSNSEPVVNGKIQNLTAALDAARHDVLVISDSDVELRPDYLRTIVAPLADSTVGYVCTLYRAVRAATWYERLELLTLNGDFVVNVAFAEVTGASGFCLGASTAVRRSTLAEIGGFSVLADYLVEDFEMGRRIRARGYQAVLLPYFVDTVIGLKSAVEWWRHHLYWDQNTRAARPIGFFASVLVRGVPFAFGFAALRLFDPIGLLVFLGALGIRLATTAVVLGRHGIRDAEGMRSLWLLPLRDLAGLASWALALSKRTFVWRGLEFGLTRDGRIVPREASA